MTKYATLVLMFAGLLAACESLAKQPAPASLFAAPISTTLLAVSIPVRGAEATLLLVARNQGVETWQTGDAVSISLRGGLIVGTRGLGFDVMGSDVSQTLSALSGGRAGPYSVTRSYLTADNQPGQVTASCKMRASGKDRHHIEECSAATGSFRNEYWLDGAGRVVRSVQWIGPEIQYLNISHVVSG